MKQNVTIDNTKYVNQMMQTEDVIRTRNARNITFEDSSKRLASESSNRSMKRISTRKRRWFSSDSPQISNAEQNLRNVIHQFNDSEIKEFEKLDNEDSMYFDFHRDYAEDYL